jgi:hypothetical protein
MHATFRRLIALLPLLASAGATAMSIGEINVTSHLGEPLRARVPVNFDDTNTISDDCVRLAGPSRHHPDLADVQVVMSGQGLRRTISITTPGPINDPMLDLVLRVEGCGPSMQKDVVVLLSPKRVEPIELGFSQPTLPVVDEPDELAKPARKAPRPVRAESVETSAPPALPVKKQSPRFALKLDYDDTAFGQIAERVAQRKQVAYQAKVRRNAEAARRTATHISPDAQELLAKVEPRPTKPSAPAPAAPVPARPQPAPVTEPMPSTSQAAPSTDRLVLQPAPSSGELLEPSVVDLDAAPGLQTGAEQSAGAVGGNVEAGSTARSGAEGGATGQAAGLGSSKWAWLPKAYNILMLLLLLLLIVLIALWLKQRKKPKSRFLDKSATTLEELSASAPLEEQPRALITSETPPVDEVFVEPPEAKTLLGEAFETRPPSINNEPLEFKADLGTLGMTGEGLSVEQHDSFDHVMELAEVMLAFGRSGQAIETLSQHIQDNPRQSIEPWLKLLELYHQSNLRTEFEALSTDLHKYFNVAIIDWTEYSTSHAFSVGTPASLESLPHIMARLTELWNTPDGLSYLNKLIEDNRGGQRLGFSVPLVRDILLLRDILRQTCPASPTTL